MSKDALAAIRTQVMWNRLIAVVEEQAQTLMRTAFSPIVREAGDLYARTGKRSEGHSYDNAYSAEYTLVRSSPSSSSSASSAGEGEWKVAGVLVTGEPRSRSA